MAEYNHNSHIKGSKESFGQSKIHISILDQTVQSDASYYSSYSWILSPSIGPAVRLTTPPKAAVSD